MKGVVCEGARAEALIDSIIGVPRHFVGMQDKFPGFTPQFRGRLSRFTSNEVRLVSDDNSSHQAGISLHEA
jgi:hypothetical protein